MTLEVSPEELTILVQALSCYDLEIANEDDDDYPIYKQLRKQDCRSLSQKMIEQLLSL